MSQRLDALIDSHHLQPLLPVIYIAWADGTLANEESQRIRELAETIGPLASDDARVLDQWLSPNAEPSATECSVLRRHIREQVGHRQP